MGNSNAKKDATLGMSNGKANSRLRKRILFHLLQKYGEDVCFVCGKKIETIDELSIEHKLPWEGISAKLFWDLDNIAFSHLKCNRPHRRGKNYSRRKKLPEGMLWCGGHKDYLPIENFYKKASRWTGYQVNCKECHDIKRGRKILNGPVAHLGERRTCNAEAAGAEPVRSTNFKVSSSRNTYLK